MSDQTASGIDVGATKDTLETALAMVAAALFIGTFVSREPAVAAWLWRKNDTYGSAAAWEAQAKKVDFLGQPLTRRALDEASALELQAYAATDQTERARAMVRGKTFAGAALHLLWLPVFVVAGVLGIKVGRRWSGTDDIGLLTASISLDAASGLGRAPIPEQELPWA